MDTKPTNLALGANFTLLGADLSAAYAKIGDNHKVLIMPTRPDLNEGITLKKLVADVNAMAASFSGGGAPMTEDMVQGAMPQQPSGGWESIKIKLSMVYLYYNSEGSVLDFAFKLDVDASELLPKGITLVNISSLSLAVWNTNNRSIVERMQLYLPEPV